jgi:hypothetical protein
MSCGVGKRVVRQRDRRMASAVRMRVHNYTSPPALGPVARPLESVDSLEFLGVFPPPPDKDGRVARPL